MITIQHHYGTKPISSAIRNATDGNFNHTSILIRGLVYESHIDCGVRRVAYKDWDNSTVVKSHSFESPYEIMVMKWLDMQVGKKYDWIGALSVIFKKLKPRKGYWFCSELAIVALGKALGVKVKDQKLSPQNLFDICELLSHKI